MQRLLEAVVVVLELATCQMLPHLPDELGGDDAHEDRLHLVVGECEARLLLQHLSSCVTPFCQHLVDVRRFVRAGRTQRLVLEVQQLVGVLVLAAPDNFPEQLQDVVVRRLQNPRVQLAPSVGAQVRAKLLLVHFPLCTHCRVCRGRGVQVGEEVRAVPHALAALLVDRLEQELPRRAPVRQEVLEPFVPDVELLELVVVLLRLLQVFGVDRLQLKRIVLPAAALLLLLELHRLQPAAQDVHHLRHVL